MIHVVLYQPDIPQNTGNIARTCALIGAKLHLIRPLGFSLDAASIRRAGLDYWDKVDVTVHDTLDDFLHVVPVPVYLLSSHGDRRYSDVTYEEDCAILFGAEASGVPQSVHELFHESRLTIPMRHLPGLRSLNLANSVAVVCYEIWRQRSFHED